MQRRPTVELARDAGRADCEQELLNLLRGGCGKQERVRNCISIARNR